MTPDQAEMIAIRALHHISENATLMEAFLNVSGLQVHDLREAASSPGFLASVLDFLRQDEAECLAFASNAGFSAVDLERASLSLSHGMGG